MSEIGNEYHSCDDDNELMSEENIVDRNTIVPDNMVEVIEQITDEVTEVVPIVGMKFTSYDEAFEFYKQYAYKVGFPVRKRNSKKGADGSLTNATFSCSREGKRFGSASTSLNPHPTMQTGCKAKITICSDMLGTWRVTKLHLEHNHMTSPSKSRLYRCNRQLNDQVKRKLEVNDIAGIPMHKSFNAAVVEAGGYEDLAFIEKDCRNYIDKVRRLRLGEGDAAAIQAYFLKMQTHCPGFFFSVDLDDECHLKNVFWADKRCRLAYKDFGDVVTFDTTYLTNRYDMPFAPFVGVNHHGQSTLLGCGLLSNEDTKTFVWLFRTWLECMDGVPPLGIITDQDRAMQNAIAIVFPNTRHRWCLWHILKKLPEKFGYHTQKASVMHTVHEVVYESQTPEEFEQGWGSFLEVYSLHDHDWLKGLFQERARWVPCFLRSSFWAGMSTTQRSESMNAFFDGYVHSKTSLKQFVEQYERALRTKVEKEFHADFRSFSQMVPCATRFGIEKQFQEAYTISKFKEFQEELTGKVYCDVMFIEEGYGGTKYVVREQIKLDGMSKRKEFTVMYDTEKCHVICSCHLFEFRGIVCRHCLTVLIRDEVELLPESYVLRRWKRGVVRSYTRVNINYNGWINSPSQLRYDKLCKSFEKMANLLADDESSTEELLEWIESHMTDLSVGKTSYASNHLSQSKVRVGSEGGTIENTQSVKILDPQCTKTKGAPRKLRKKGPLETTTKKSKTSSKSTKGKRTMQSTDEDIPSNTHSTREPEFQMFNQFGYSQQLMVPPLHSWGGAYRGTWNVPHGINAPLMPMYAAQHPPGEEFTNFLHARDFNNET